MKDVKFTQDMAPHRIGDRRVVPDDVAERMEAAGEVTDVQPFPPNGRSQAKPQRPIIGRRPAAGYQTKGGAR